MTNASSEVPRGALTAALLLVGLMDLAWLAWPAVALVLSPALAFFWLAARVGAGSGGCGSVSAGFSEALVEGMVLPVPLVLHGVAQVLARRVGADVRRWWRLHVMAYVACLLVVALMIGMRPASLPDSALGIGLVGGLLVGVGQHVVIAIVIVSGLRALSRTPVEAPPREV